MTDITIFQNPEFGNIRTMRDEKGEPLFCLKDVCEVLDLRTQKIVQRLEDDVLSKYPIVDNLGRTQHATFVNEDGLYDTILESRKPGAKAFRKWVTSEVLPSIRKQGGYMVARADEPDEVLFCGRDVAKALGYKKPENAIATHVDDEDKTSTLIQGSGSNYKSKTIFINESGIYSLILRAQVDSAKRFTKWVTSEVLPSSKTSNKGGMKRHTL